LGAGGKKKDMVKMCTRTWQTPGMDEFWLVSNKSAGDHEKYFSLNKIQAWFRIQFEKGTIVIYSI
jgi:hypothetical protein